MAVNIINIDQDCINFARDFFEFVELKYTFVMPRDFLYESRNPNTLVTPRLQRILEAYLSRLRQILIDMFQERIRMDDRMDFDNYLEESYLQLVHNTQPEIIELHTENFRQEFVLTVFLNFCASMSFAGIVAAVRSSDEKHYYKFQLSRKVQKYRREHMNAATWNRISSLEGRYFAFKQQ